MTDFASLQEKFDKDPALSKRFIADPVGVLKSEGVDISPQQAAELKKSVSAIGKAGSKVAAGSKVDVSVSISVRF
jgi:hypothetical protein